jgi:hypothetical protein
VVEHAVAGCGSRNHCRGVIRQLVFDDQSRAVFVKSRRRHSSGAQRFIECSVERQLDRHIPVGRAARARMAALVIRMNAERVNGHYREHT